MAYCMNLDWKIVPVYILKLTECSFLPPFVHDSPWCMILLRAKYIILLRTMYTILLRIHYVSTIAGVSILGSATARGERRERGGGHEGGVPKAFGEGAVDLQHCASSIRRVSEKYDILRT